MKYLCFCIICVKYEMPDEAVWFWDLSSSHSLQSLPTSLYSGEFQLFASPTEWVVFCDEMVEESSTEFKQFWKWLFLQMGAGAINIIMLPSILIPVTWFPEHKGLVGTNMKILFLGQINSPPKQKTNRTTIYSHQGVGHCHLRVWSLFHCILSASNFPHQPKQLESNEGNKHSTFLFSTVYATVGTKFSQKKLAHCFCCRTRMI